MNSKEAFKITIAPKYEESEILECREKILRALSTSSAVLLSGSGYRLTRGISDSLKVKHLTMEEIANSYIDDIRNRTVQNYSFYAEKLLTAPIMLIGDAGFLIGKEAVDELIYGILREYIDAGGKLIVYSTEIFRRLNNEIHWTMSFFRKEKAVVYAADATTGL